MLQTGLKKISLALLFAAGSGLSSVAQAEPAHFLYEVCSSCAAKDLVYSSGEFDQVHLFASEAGGAGVVNTQPVQLSAEAISKLLQQVQLEQGGRQQALFDEDSAQSLANGIAAFAAKAQAGQDGIFLITNRSSSGFVSGKQGNSGRVFVNADGLNLILGEAHVEFFNAYRATRMLRKFDFGSRKSASKVVLKSAYAQAGRSDWLRFPLHAQAMPAPVAPTVSMPILSPTAPALQPAASAPAPIAKPSIEEKFQAHEARLKGLKRLREQNLISEEEYQAKRREILKDL